MRRRRIMSRKPAKPRPRKTVTPERDTASNAVRRVSSSTTDLQTQLERQARELEEARKQQAATSEVLQVIASSPADLKAVFETILANATRICEARFGVLYRAEGETLRVGAMHRAPKAFVEERRRNPVIRPSPKTTLGRVMLTRRPVQIADVREEPGHADAPSGFTGAKIAQLAGARTVVGVPLLKESELVGVILIFRQEVRPFTDKQIELVQNFAAQAVIAIENTRLLNELRESLQQQTATADVLKVISRSTFDLGPVFETVVENAVRLCGADRGFLFRFDGELLRMAAFYNASPELTEWVRQNPITPGRRTVSARAALERRTVQVPDVQADSEVAYAVRDVAPIRTMLSVPMLKGDALVGVIAIYRLEVRPFTDQQIALVETFADQAAIAIENVRLFNELRESLQQQTATADVLQVISRSTFDLQAVFNALVESAARLCDAKRAMIWRQDGESYKLAANYGFSREFEEFCSRNPIFPERTRGTITGRTVLTGKTVHIPDVAADPDFTDSAYQIHGGFLSGLGVPLLREGAPIGVFALTRPVAKPFTDKQIELVQNFAAQAVIAIENTRLLNELRQRTTDLSESLEQQTATSEVLEVISGSQGRLQPIFDAMLGNATRLCEASFGALWLREEGGYRNAALHGDLPELYLARWRSGDLYYPGPGAILTRATDTLQPIHVVDLREDQGYKDGEPVTVAAVEVGIRTVVVVPMLRDDSLIGFIAIYRKEVRSFTAKQIALVTNFARQAVIAIENTRLLNELRESLQQQTATSQVLQVISTSPGELGPVFQAILSNGTRICEAKFGTLYLCEGDGFRAVATHNAPPAYVQARAAIVRPHRDSSVWRAAKTKQVVQVTDVTKLPGYLSGDPFLVTAVAHGGYRTVLSVPMLKEEEVIGIICIYRQEVRSFTDKQIEVLTNFAAQAVIAIENARLLNELRESLQQQTATADVLKVISRSTFDLKAVLTTLVEFGRSPVRSRSCRDSPSDGRQLSVCSKLRLSAGVR